MSRALTTRHDRGDAGFTLIELMVSFVLLLIMFGMIMITMSFFMTQSASQTAQTQSATNAETSLWTVRVPLRYAETPYAASLANTAAGPVSATSPCWGSSSPSFAPAMAAISGLGNTAKAAGGAAYGVLGSPADDAILVAHDFDVLFCAPANHSSFTAAPHIYRLWIDPSTCTNRTATGGGGCTLKLDDYGTNPFANCAWTSGTSLPSTCPTPPTPVTSSAVAANVWCNLSCQQDVVGTLTNPTNNLTQPPLFTYLSSPSSTTPIVTPSDITNDTGANLPGIHEIDVNLGTINGNPSATASVSSGTTNSTSHIYLGSTITSSTTVLDSAPVVTAVSPASGPVAGGNTVTLTGNYFSNANGVSFCPTSGTGCVVSTSFTVVSDTSMTAVVPPNAAGVDDVVVASVNNGNSAKSSADSYSYYPTVTGVSPNLGPTGGGTTVTITGTGFAAPATVNFGLGTATSVVVNSSTRITATTPAAATAGPVDTTVTELNATSPTSAADTFTYTAPATISSVSPSTGPIAGGTTVTLTGSNFTGATLVTFGGVPGTGLVVNSDSSLTVTTPAHAVGVVTIVLTTTTGTVTDANAFTYVPTVTALSSNYGPLAGSGGTQITITGTGFAAGATVKFGANSSASVTYVSPTSIKASVPAGVAGTVDVIVTVSGTSSQPVVADQYTYVANPTVTAVSPPVGPLAGGTSVTITGTSFAGVTAVKFGATNASSYVINSPTSITAVSPAGAAGTVDVTVTNGVGTSITSAADHFSYVPAPTVTTVSPAIGPAAGGTTVTITGTNLSAASAVTFGGVAASITSDNATQIVVTTPPGSGAVSVVVTTPGGSVTAGTQFTYAPTVTGIYPPFGSGAGGTTVAITGTGFTGTTSVKFGATNATSFTVISSTQISAVSPASLQGSTTTSGTVDVTVTTPAGASPTVAADQFSYSPTVTGVAPTSGPGSGGTPVTITGTNFTGATAVLFGVTAVPFTVTSPTTILVYAPPSNQGTVDIIVVTPGGPSGTSVADQYSYYPTITTVSPNEGPTAGGTSVTITGTNFSGSTVIKFGTTAAASITLNSSTSITAVSPAGAPGTVDVTATSAGGTSPTTGGDQFTFVPPPVVTSVTPSSGPGAGGTPVTITGSGFSLATTVSFGPVAASSFSINSDTSISVTSPTGTTGLVDVTVSSVGGTSLTSPADQFTYAPTVTSISPTSGSAAGGTVVTISGTNLTVASGVLFGTTNATSYTINSNSQITATAPATVTASTVDVTVTSSAGTSPTSPADQYTFVSVATGLSPTTGPVGTAATINAAGFLPSTALTVTVGGNPATITSGGTTAANGTATVSFTVPADTTGVQPVVVSDGTYSATSATSFTVTSSATGLSPTSAPILSSVTVTANGFAATHALTVTVGGTAASITAGGTTNANGSSTVTFTVPAMTIGSYAVVVSDGTSPATASPNLSVTVGAPAKLAFTTQPAGAVDGVVFTTQPRVTVQDAGGNTVTTSSASISLASSGATLACATNPVSAVAGVSSFTGCTITGPIGSYTLTASSSGLASATSSPLPVTIGAASAVVVTTPVAGAAYGLAFTTQPVATIKDVGGNTVTTSSAPVGLAITAQPGSGTLTCTGGLSKAAVAGIATFSGCTITGPVGSYTLTASSAGLTSGTTTFTLAPGTATKVVFTTQPAGAVDGVAFTTQPVVTVEDGGGNTVTGSSAAVTVLASSGTLSGCTAAVNAVSGVATFANCAITGSTASSYTLTALSAGLASATSSSFSLGVGSASKLAFTTQPAGAVDGVAFTTQPRVTVQDVGGNTVTTSSAPVTLSAGGLSCTTNPASASSGVATFSGCAITGPIGAYTLTAASSGLTSATSASVTLTVGAASAVVVTTPVAGAAYGLAFTTQPVATIEDVGGNTVTTSSAPVGLAITAQPGSGTLTCTGGLSKAAVAGIATFSGCTITGPVGSYTLTASSSGLTSGTTTFTLAPGTATKVVFTTQPAGAVDGVAFTTQPVVTVEDGGGNTVTGSSAAVTLTASTGTLSGCTAAVNAVSGVATFANCTIAGSTASSYTLTATSAGLASATSSSFSLGVGSASKLAFTTQPAGAVDGVAFTTQPRVTVQDVGGNTVTTSSAPVTLSAGGLSCTTNPASASSGVATFSGCAITGPIGPYTLTAASSGLTSATSSSVTLTIGAATALSFATQPAGAVDGVAFTTQPKVNVVDIGGNVVTTSSASVSMVSSGASLTGCAPVAAVSGVATFSSCTLTGTTGSYSLTASSGGLSSITSSPVTLAVGSATKLVFTTQPAGAVDAVAFTTQPVVTVQDVGGNTVTGSSAPVTLAIATQPGTGATQSCSAAVNATSGIATFSGCSITGTIGAYTLSASSTGLTGATSAPVTVTIGSGARLTMTTNPAGAVYGVPFTTQPVITVVDAGGNTVTTSTASVSLAINTQPGTGASLSCTANPVTAVGGVATFAGCNLTGIVGGYTLTAIAATLSSATSGTLTLAPGAATQVAFTTQPAGAVDGVAFTTQPVVKVQDGGGNTVTTSSASVTVTASGGTLSGCTGAVTAVSGVATFANCTITGTTGPYTLTATSSGLSSGTSSSFTLAVGAASKLVMTTQPAGTVDGIAFTTQPVVTVEDIGGNTVTGSSAPVSLNASAGTLSGCTSAINATAGVATFANCAITGPVGAYSVTAVSSGLASATSNTFTLSIGAASKLAVTTAPAGASYATAFTTQPVVTVQDVGGNTITGSSAPVTLAITAQPGSGTLTCTGGQTATAVSGVATFAGCAITGPTGSYTLTASSSGLTSTTTTFTLAPGTATKVAFTTQPAGAADGVAFTTQPVVTIEDAGGNTVTGSSASVTLTASGATLSGCTAALTATSGVATFSACALTGTVGSYTLTATSSGLASATSSSISLTIGAASKLTFTTQPAGAVDGVAFTTQPVVKVQDVGGNTVTSSSASVSLSAGGLSCTTNPVTAGSGVATFSGCKLTGIIGSYTLTAASSGLTSATSASVTLTAGSATTLAVTTPAAGAAYGTAFTTQPVVSVQDVGGNTIIGSSAPVTLAITAQPGSGTLTCTGGLTATAVSGVATFAGCAITGPIGSYTLTATSSGLTSATTTFPLSAGPASKLVVTTQPAGAVDGVAFTTQPVVTVEDAGGNTVTTSSASVTLTSSGATLSGCTGAVTATSGVATFSACALTGTIGSYTLTASSSGLTSATSASISLAIGPATALSVTTPVSGAAYGAAFTTQPVVTVQDVGGNTVTTSSASVTLAITAQPGSGTLTCTGGLSKAAVAGVATFGGCQITGLVGSYTLTATSGALTSSTTTFTLTYGTAAKVAFTTQPAGAVDGIALTTQPVVTIQDGGGNTVTNSTAPVTLSSSPTGLSGCTTAVNAVSGVATFSGCVLTGTIGSYTLTAASTGLTSGLSSPVTLAIGAANKLAATAKPVSTTTGTLFATQPAITVQDVGGNTISSGIGSTASITLSISAQPGGGTLACTTNPLSATSGLATFAGCKLTGTTGGTYTLQAAATGLTSATFNVSMFTKVQDKATSSTGTSSFTINLSTAPATGDALVLIFSSSNTSTTTNTVSSVSGGGVTWVPAVQGKSANGDAEIWYGTGVTSGTTLITINLSSSNEVDIADVSEWAGMLNGTALDTTGKGSGSSASGTSISTPTITPTNLGDLVITTAYAGGGSTSAPPGPTNSFIVMPSTLPTVSTKYKGYGAYFVEPSNAAISTTWSPTPNGKSSTAIAAFLP